MIDENDDIYQLRKIINKIFNSIPEENYECHVPSIILLYKKKTVEENLKVNQRWMSI